MHTAVYIFLENALFFDAFILWYFTVYPQEGLASLAECMEETVWTPKSFTEQTDFSSRMSECAYVCNV